MENVELRAALMNIKACDLREDALYQCETAIDRGIHVGGAYSAIPILTALFYGGEISLDIENPTSREQDVFVLSKGHAIAALASVYADLGYIRREDLKNSRGFFSKIKGHPGPLIPGVPVATGPLGHGISLAAGYALSRREENRFQAYCLVGDGELQEGSNWEGLMYAADRGLRNLCVMIDANHGQSDNTTQLLVSMERIGAQLEAMGYRVLNAYGDHMRSLLSALHVFRTERSDNRPTAIIVHGQKGYGGYGSVMGKHKASISQAELENERRWLAEEKNGLIRGLARFERADVLSIAKELGYQATLSEDGAFVLERVQPVYKVRRAPKREKRLRYNEDALPRFKQGETVGTTELLTACMAVLAQDDRLYTIDSDLSNASGLYDGVRRVNGRHALNVGIAECNMMCIGEALASEGRNVWTSTFTPFFDLQAFRRIAVSYQERQEEIEAPDGWLSEGHNLDMTFLGTSANLDTAVNGATHMGNDDNCIYGQLAHVRVIDTCCPQQLLSVVKWIAEGNRGLIYLRTMRGGAPVLYPADYRFEYGRGYALLPVENARLVIVSSGRGIAEALGAAEILKDAGITIGVVDMPSLDMDMLGRLIQDRVPVFFAEQNNGFLFDQFSRRAIEMGLRIDPGLVFHASTRDENGNARFISSGTYDQLVQALGLSRKALADRILSYIQC